MKRSLFALIAGALLASSFAVFAGPGGIEGVEKQPVNVSAIAMFMVFVLATLGFAWAAATGLPALTSRFAVSICRMRSCRATRCASSSGVTP